MGTVLKCAEMQFLRNSLIYTLQYRQRSEHIRAELEGKDMIAIISTCRIQWGDHLQRITEDRLPKAVLKYKPIGRCV